MKTLKQQIGNRCVHFSGVQHKQCEAGVAYQGGNLPCFRDGGDKRNWACNKVQFPTGEEVEAELDRKNAAMAKFAKAGPIIDKIKKEYKGQNWGGVEVCPVCNGRLHLAHAAYNGHVCGKCETAGCLGWME